MHENRSWGINRLNKHDSEEGRRRPESKSLLTLVALGIALFVVGFIVSITSLSDPSAASSEGADSGGAGELSNGSLVLLTGLLLSLGGVVMATAGPAMMFIQARKRSS